MRFTGNTFLSDKYDTQKLILAYLAGLKKLVSIAKTKAYYTIYKFFHFRFFSKELTLVEKNISFTFRFFKPREILNKTSLRQVSRLL